MKKFKGDSNLNSTISFSILRIPSEENREGINRITPQLTPNGGQTSRMEFVRIVRDPNNTFVVARDKTKQGGDAIIGMGILVLMWTPVKLRARIESVVVDAAYRGRGLGGEIIKRLVDAARKKRVYEIKFGSEAEHVEANKLYQELGFELQKNVNTYRMKL